MTNRPSVESKDQDPVVEKTTKALKTGDIDPSDGYEFVLEQPKQDTMLLIQSAVDQLDLRLKGLLLAVALPPESFLFEVVILNEINKLTSPVLPKTKLLIKRSAEEEEIIAFNQDNYYDFDFQYLIPAEEGVYLLKIWLKGKIVYVGRFRVERFRVG